MYHLKASKGITGRLVNAGKPLNDKTTLAEAGITENTVVEMKSFITPKRFTNNIAVKFPHGDVFNVQVHSGTTIGELKHKLQDEINMPVEEQILEENRFSKKTQWQSCRRKQASSRNLWLQEHTHCG